MSQSFRVIVTNYITDDLAPEREVLGELAEVSALGARAEDELFGRVEEADALILFHQLDVTRRSLERLKKCRVIARAGVGFENIDHAFARSRGIPVCNVPDYGTEEVADSAIGMALALARGIHMAASRLRAGDRPWSHDLLDRLARLRGATLGIVGLGRIGTATALRAKALGLEVLFYDPYKPDGYDKALGLRRVETLEELMAGSLIVSIHCPGNAETHHMIDAAMIARMPRGSYLVNTARGPIIDTPAVPEAIAAGTLAGAAIDVFEDEPVGDDDPLVRAWRDLSHPAHHRLLLTPHTAFYSEAGLRDMRVKSAQTCRRALLGLPLRNVIN